MAVKTITITEHAYDALKHQKQGDESFSQTILRVVEKKSLHDFFGVLDRKTGEQLEKSIKQRRVIRNKVHRRRMHTILNELNEV